MLDTPQRYPRAGSQSYPTPAAVANSDGSTTVYFGPRKPAGDGNWIQTVPGKGWSTLLRFYSPLEPFFTKACAQVRLGWFAYAASIVSAEDGRCWHIASRRSA